MRKLFYLTLGFIKSFKPRGKPKMSGKIGPPYNGCMRMYGYEDHTKHYVYFDGEWEFVRRGSR